VRGLARGGSTSFPEDPEIEWQHGDLRDPATRLRAVSGVRAVIHAAGWVSLGRDPHGLSQSVNVDATRGVLADARRAGVERFVMSSTIHTLAAGPTTAPADETSSWNLECVDSPYARSKRAAEAHVQAASTGAFTTLILCLGMVIGPRDPKPTSTRLLRTLARSVVALLPGGGISIVDATVVARAHRRALVAGEPGERYAIVGPYVSYRELARLVAQVAGRPRLVIALPDSLRWPLKTAASLLDRLNPQGELSGTTVAGGFLSLHVSGQRGDTCFGLEHPTALETVRSAFTSAIRAQDVQAVTTQAKL
jgi:dihydroflavonol-4-reductase